MMRFGVFEPCRYSAGASLAELLSQLELKRVPSPLRLVNKDGKPVTSGIRKWAACDLEDNPLPRRYLGDLPRFFRPDVIRWTEEETKRRYSKMKLPEHQEKTVVKPFPVQEDNASALTAAAS